MEKERRIWFNSTRVFYLTISASSIVSLFFCYWLLRNSPCDDFNHARFEFTDEISVSSATTDDSDGGGAEGSQHVLDSILHNTAQPKRAEPVSSANHSNLLLKNAHFKEGGGGGGRGFDVKIEKRTCDVSKGKWVFDETYPLYSNASCPYIDEGFNCQTNGRLDSDYMKWRWQPDHCDIPRFNAVKMLEMIRGKRMVFVGDSISRNQWESMMCLLRNGVKNRKKVFEARGRRITKTAKSFVFRFVDYQCSIEYHVTHFLVRESKARVGKKRVPTLRIDSIDRSFPKWRGADILVFNSGHWWSHYKTKSGKNYYQEGSHVHPHLDASIAYRRAIKTWATWVDSNVNSHETQVFFRTYEPSHYSGGEWNSGGHCKERTKPLNSSLTVMVEKSTEKNVIVEQITKQMKTPVTILNVTKITGLRIDGHPSVYGIRRTATSSSNRVQDCSHWCLPGVPDTWNELLYFFLQSKHSKH